MTGSSRAAQISASLLNADYARLGDEVRRAVDAGVDSIHLDVMDGHFVENLTIGPAVVEAVRPLASVPYHAHLMVSQPLRHARAFADAGSDHIVAHVEADDERPGWPSTPRHPRRRCCRTLTASTCCSS